MPTPVLENCQSYCLVAQPIAALGWLRARAMFVPSSWSEGKKSPLNCIIEIHLIDMPQSLDPPQVDVVPTSHTIYYRF